MKREKKAPLESNTMVNVWERDLEGMVAREIRKPVHEILVSLITWTEGRIQKAGIGIGFFFFFWSH